MRLLALLKPERCQKQEGSAQQADERKAKSVSEKFLYEQGEAVYPSLR